MTSSKGANSVKSAIVLLLTLVIVAGVLIFVSGEKQDSAETQNSIIASQRAKVDLKAMYGAADRTITDTAQVEKREKRPVAEPAKKRVPVKETTEAAGKKSVAKASTVKKRAQEKTTVKKLPTPKEIKAAMPSGEKPWAINVASFSSEAPANSLKAKLISAGYNTYVTDFLKGGVKWHRVRVGFFTSREDAIKFGKALGKRLNVTSKPWPVRPQWDEISGHITK